MKVNDVQIGGDHYKKKAYQHWDFVCDTGMHYILGCASKYVCRWKDKGGIDDLEKSRHYIQKAKEREITAPCSNHLFLIHDMAYDKIVTDFVTQFDTEEKEILYLMCYEKYDDALYEIGRLIAKAKFEENERKIKEGSDDVINFI